MKNNSFSSQLKHQLPHMWRFALRLTRSKDVAEDLVQKSALRALEKRHQYKEGTELKSWLFKIQHTIWKNDLRSTAIRQQYAINLMNNENEANATHDAETHLLFREVLKHTYALPEAQRLVLILVCVEGYSYKETADILDIAIGTVMSRLSRARLTIGAAFLDTEYTVTPVDQTGRALKEKENEN